MAFLYVDSFGLDDQILRRLPSDFEGNIGYDLEGEHDLIALLKCLSADRERRLELGTQLLDLLNINHERAGDERIRQSILTLARDPGGRHALEELAAAVNLSPSRYLHLFKKSTGVTLRRYRLWIRLGAAVRALARGKNLTEAALDAGFSSSAHFSFVFKTMFGMAPSGLSGIGVRYERVPVPPAANA